MGSKSRSRSRSPKRNKHYFRDRDSSSSDRQARRKYKPEKSQRDREDVSKSAYSFRSKSDIKCHIKYDNIRIHSNKEASDIMEQVRAILEKEFGPVYDPQITNKQDNYFSFGIGFRYDDHALNFIN